MGLPFIGIMLAGYQIAKYFDFPPKTQYVSHAPFSWIAFTALSLFVLATFVPIIIKGFRRVKLVRDGSVTKYFFPWWGWVGVFTGAVAWTFAWTRFPWFAQFQPHTFFPLWFSFILVVNALSYRKSGYCMIINRPVYFLLLFPVSATFWWFFEYLNRFVQNWHYVGATFGPWEYFWYATLSFSTVLPAVLGVRDLLLNASWLEKGFGNFMPIEGFQSKFPTLTVLVLSGIGLVGIGVWPDYLFLLLWISPLLIIVSVMSLFGESSVLSGIKRGDWRVVISSSLAAFVCGFFWEMWNFYSLAKWVYSVPFVHRFQIFEMPILGYAGYFPFGLECAVIGGLLEGITKSKIDGLVKSLPLQCSGTLCCIS